MEECELEPRLGDDLTIAQAAEHLGVSITRIRQLIRQDRVVGAHKFGSVWAIPTPIRIRPAKHGPSGVADKTSPDKRRRRVRKAAGG